MRHIIGLDIGGANLKAAHSNGECRSRAFPLWKHPERLADELRMLVADWLPCRAFAVSMTAELADCFTTKAEGVDRVLKSVEELAGETDVLVWQTVGEFVAPDVAREFPLLTSAANWHLLATYFGRLASSGGALVLDVGSTTTDIIPLHDGFPIPTGVTDGERLQSGELVYCGARRTPISALADAVPFRGQSIRLSSELFATTLDVYLLLNDIAEDELDLDTANGRSATRDAAYDRLARMLCCDRTEVTWDEVREIAAYLSARQINRIRMAIDDVLCRMSQRCEHVILSGSGCFLAERIVAEHPVLSGVGRTRLDGLLSSEICDAACAFAAARLLEEQW